MPDTPGILAYEKVGGVVWGAHVANRRRVFGARTRPRIAMVTHRHTSKNVHHLAELSGLLKQSDKDLKNRP